MDQDDREALKSFGWFAVVIGAWGALVFGWVRADKNREDEYRTCLQVGGTGSECSRLVNPSAWQKQHDREERARKQLEALRRNL